MKKTGTILILFLCLLCLFGCKAEEQEEPKGHVHEFQDGFCIHCGLMCEHDIIINGKCKICGKVMPAHKHHFLRGKCIECGYECVHDIEKCNQMCSICGYVREHEYVDGKCIYCGDIMNYETGTLNSKYKSKVADTDAGSVEKVVFQSYDYANNNPFENTFFVYLPNSYYKEFHLIL